MGDSMKTLMQPIDMISYTFTNGGPPQPIRFKIAVKDGQDVVVSIDRVVSVEFEKFAGNPMYRYTCRGIIAGKERQFELKFEVNTCKWYLFGI